MRWCAAVSANHPLSRATPEIRALIDRGDTVSALVRSQDAAEKVSAFGVTRVTGLLTDADTLRASAAQADGVIHLACTNDTAAGAADRAGLEAMLDGAGTKPYVHVGGAWSFGSTAGAVDEDAPYSPPMVTSWRTDNEKIVLQRQNEGAHPVIVMPGLVYGHGGGLPGFFAHLGRSTGAVPYLGDGSSRRSLVHVEDIAQLFVLALSAPAGARFLGTTGQNPTTRRSPRRSPPGSAFPARPGQSRSRSSADSSASSPTRWPSTSSSPPPARRTSSGGDRLISTR